MLIIDSGFGDDIVSSDSQGPTMGHYFGAFGSPVYDRS
jgi:hypothetical protein